ncbi:MAG: alpha-2-macroglobulin [Sulfurimicrobium sp.]|nr:alpha-2-macroglobulin [Sulfurimicrobium sp.]
MKLPHFARRGFGLIPLLVLIGMAAAATVLVVKQPWKSEAMADSEGHFALVEVANRDLDGSPALAATFTLPLDPKRSYDEFVQVFEMPARPGEAQPRHDENADEGMEQDGDPREAGTAVSSSDEDVEIKDGKLVKGSWVVGENPRLLYFPHIKPQTRYVVKIAAGLPALGGKKLDSESRYSVRTAAVSPAYYFASRGMVLPARQNGGLPVVTVNVPEVDVQFLRVKPDQLPRFLDRVISGPRPAPRQHDADEEGDYYEEHDWRATDLKGAVNNWSLDTLHKLTESVYVGRFLTEQKANKRNVTFLPVEDIKELREPGIYIAVMSQPNRFRYDYQVSYFYVSDLGLTTHIFTKGADAYVSSLTSGKAVSGVEVSWLDENAKVLARAETDGEGRAPFAERPAQARVIVAKKGAELSLIALKEPALDLSEYEVSGPPGKPVSLFAYSGRNIYRPGESFDLSILARDSDGRPIPAQPVQAILKRPDGKNQFTATWQPEQKFGGYYRHIIEIPGDAPTGFWTLELRVDPADKRATTSFRFGVEEFMPERMKLDLASTQKTLVAEQPFKLAVQGDYLYGAPAAGNRLLGVAQFERNKNPLAQKLPGFEFGDSNEDSQKKRVELEERTLNDEGHADIDIDLGPASGKRSPYTVRATLSLLESGGRPVIRSIERTLWPAPVLVGIRPLFIGDYAREGSMAQFEVVRSDAEARLFGANALPVRLFRENRDYYWRFDDQRGWHSGFAESDELVGTYKVDIAKGARGKLGVPVKYGRYRVEITDPETSQTLKYRFYAGWSARADETQGIRPDRVALKLDKPAYKEGETARLTLTPPHAGEALVTVEADKTLWVKRISVPLDGTTLDIPLDKAWKRHDLYVSAVVLRPGSEGEKVTPARALGLLHLPLERSDRKLTATLEAPRKMLPSSPLKVRLKVPEAKGQQAVVTLSAVDVGILNITRFATPDPFGHFFGKLRYGADMYDVYGRLIEKLGGQKGKLKFGGDSAPKATRSLPKKVRLVDLFSGPVALNAQGEAEITLDVPDFNGTLRLMAVVATPDRFANAESEVVVAAPLVAELLTPRFLTIGDQAVVALDLHNLSGAEQKLKVALINRDGLKIHNAERELTLKDQQKQTLRFNLEAGSAFGLSEVRLAVSGLDGFKLERSFGLQVQAASPNQQVVRRYAVNPGATLELKDAELSGLLKSSVQAHLQISDKAPIDVRSAISGLLTYPYGCAEQTTSTAYPHVFVDEEAARQFGLKPYTQAQRADMLEKAIARLGAMQAPNGGFSLWGNVAEYQYWLSAYVGNFLLDAREQGFKVPENMHKNGTDFLLKYLQEGVAGLPSGKVSYNESGWQDYRYAGGGRFSVLAYGAYVLARESRAPLSTLRQMYELRGQAHSGLALVHLGLALKLMGDEKRAMEVLAEGIRKPRDSGYWWGDYGSPMRDAALSYVLLERHKIKLDGQDNLVGLAADELEKNRYTSTQEKLALFLLGRNFVNVKEGTAWSAEISLRDKPEAMNEKGSRIVSLSTSDLAGGLRIRNTHKEKLYLQLSLSGHPVKMPAARDDMIELKRELFDAEGKPIGSRNLRVGETVMVRVSVNPRRHITTGMVVDRIPAGLEIENLNIVQGEGMGGVNIENINPAQAMLDPRIQHVEFRDDRFVVAARLHGRLALFYRARVVTPGSFVFPPLYAEDMYRPDVYGLALGEGSLRVSDGKE